jgi:carbonic anhydrase/acetyltransferase-like protein (isoleucine patch superfamily)
MRTHRNITQKEIDVLLSNGTECSNWDLVQVKDGFNPQYIKNTIFSGKIKLGVFEKDFTLSGGLKKHSGIYNAVIHNCTIGDNVLIENIQNYIANYSIGKNSFIQNVDVILVDGKTSFGNGVQVNVLNETGGREVHINDKLSAHFAYIYSLYRHRPKLIEKMKAITDFYCDKHSSEIGIIGNDCKILNVGYIKNVKIGPYCNITGTMKLKNGSINSNEHAPVYIGRNVIAQDFIISSGSSIAGGSFITRCFVGQACFIDHGYSASDSLFFSNCHGENGEACALFAGPYTVTHHKSTLLIAGMFSFMNAGSGSNQSNHMYKLGPIHQGIIERGAKTTSNSFILWPAKVGAFSLIMGRHSQHADTSNLPFSYLIEKDNSTYISPGINLRSVGTIRDAKKWPERDMRKDPEKLDCINFNLLSPYTIQKVFAGIEILKNLQFTAGETSEIYTFQSCIIQNRSLKRGLQLYEIIIHKFLGNSIIKRLENTKFKNNEEIRERLNPNTSIGLGEWVDLSGLIAPKSEIDNLLDQIESGEITKLKDVNHVFHKLHENYYVNEWTWAWDKIQSFYNLKPDTITAEDIIKIVEKWKESVIGLDELIYQDAQKEFSLSFKTGFGADGNIQDRAMDFEYVRGAFDKNPFVRTTLKHIEDKKALGNELIERIGNIK